MKPACRTGGFAGPTVGRDLELRRDRQAQITTVVSRAHDFDFAPRGHA
jgi:hypothetical protein